MSMIFRFKILSDENDNFYRDYALPYDMSLLELHAFICADLNFDPHNMSSFFTADREWNKGKEFTLMDMELTIQDGSHFPVSMESTLLSQLITQKIDRLIYEFDMLQERALYLELIKTLKAEPGKTYPVVENANGNPPHQFDPTEITHGSIFDEAMDEFGDFSGTDNYGDE